MLDISFSQCGLASLLQTPLMLQHTFKVGDEVKEDGKGISFFGDLYWPGLDSEPIIYMPAPDLVHLSLSLNDCEYIVLYLEMYESEFGVAITPT